MALYWNRQRWRRRWHSFFCTQISHVCMWIKWHDNIIYIFYEEVTEYWISFKILILSSSWQICWLFNSPCLLSLSTVAVLAVTKKKTYQISNPNPLMCSRDQKKYQTRYTRWNRKSSCSSRIIPKNNPQASFLTF